MSIQIVEKSGEGLSRVYGVVAPIAELNARLDKRLAEVSPQVQLKGFRPGKVPASHIRKLYGKGLMQEVVEQVMDDSQRDALEKVKLRPAASPDIKLESDIAKVLEGKEDLAFELAIEVMPDFQPIDPGSLTLKRMVHTPTDEEVTEALTEIAESAKSYETKGGKSPKAADGDMLVIDFVGRIDGVAFEGGAGEGAELVIGSGRFIPGFEEQLKGAKPGETVTVKVTFPEDYGAAQLAGKAAEFEVTVKELKAPQKAKVDDALAERLGMGDLESLTKAVKTQLEGQNAAAARFKLKRALLDQLDSSHDFPLPPRMVEGEFETIWRQVEAERAAGELAEDEKEKSEEQLRADYRKIAERRVRLGLVLAEIGREYGVTVSDQEMQGALINEARKYPGQEREVFEAFRNRPELQASLRAPVYEEKVVDLIISKAKVEDEEVSKDVLFEEDDLPAGYGG
jgi:trigger factor